MGKQDELVTGIDKFLEMINSRNTVAALDASKELGVPEETIEIWAEVLGQDGLVNIEYNGMGKMILKSAGKESANTVRPENTTAKHEIAQKSTIIETIAKRKKGSILKPRISSRAILRRVRDGAKNSNALKKESFSERILKKLGISREK